MPHARTISILPHISSYHQEAACALGIALETGDGAEAGRQKQGSGEAGEGGTSLKHLEGGQCHMNLHAGLLVFNNQERVLF